MSIYAEKLCTTPQTNDLVSWLHTENKVPPPAVEPRHSHP